MKKQIDFEIFSELILNDNITDINFNGKTLWVDHLSKGRFQYDINLNNFDLEAFCYKIANQTNKQFNNSFPILESETSDLRISILHKSIAASGYSISIRKTPPIMRLNDELLVKQNYATYEVLEFLKKIVKQRKNILISGLPGVGKTELLKYLTNYINDNERVITIEDNLEIRFSDIHPQKDGLMLQVNKTADYRDLIKASLRQRVDWLLLSEVRGIEVVELMLAISTGATLISTIHAFDAKSITKRMLHMFPGNEITNEKLLYTIHENIDYGISLKSKVSSNGIFRFIDEIVLFSVSENNYHNEIIYTRDQGFIKEVSTL